LDSGSFPPNKNENLRTSAANVS